MYLLKYYLRDNSLLNNSKFKILKQKQQDDAMDSIDAQYVMVIARCLAALYIGHSFINCYKLGSNYLMGIAVLFSLFSSFFFCTGVVNFLNAGFNKLW